MKRTPANSPAGAWESPDSRCLHLGPFSSGRIYRGTWQKGNINQICSIVQTTRKLSCSHGSASCVNILYSKAEFCLDNIGDSLEILNIFPNVIFLLSSTCFLSIFQTCIKTKKCLLFHVVHVTLHCLAEHIKYRYLSTFYMKIQISKESRWPLNQISSILSHCALSGVGNF